MAEATIPVDLLNPGQVFACMGFLEAAEVLLGNAEGGFDWTNPAQAAFGLRAYGGCNPFAVALGFLSCAEPQWVSPRDRLKERDGGPTETVPHVSPARAPSGAELPARMLVATEPGRAPLTLGYWADSTGRWSETFKKPTNGSSCHVRWRAAAQALRALGGPGLAGDPLSAGIATESSFRLDPRGYSDPIGAGTSPDKLRKGGIEVRVRTYPACEAFAVLGLEHARPEQLRQLSPGCRRFRYRVWPGYTPLVLARAALGAPLPGWHGRSFLAEHVETKRGGDRRLISVVEEDPHG